MDEIAALTPMFAGVNYERLEGYKSLQWPVAADGTDQPLHYTERFARPDGKARLYPLAIAQPTEQPDGQFDLHLNNGRLLEHFHEGNLTYRVAGIRENTPETFIEVSPALARERGIETGTLVRADLALWQSASPSARDRSGARPRAIHADELDRVAGEPLDEQLHRPDDAHAGI